MRRRTEPIRGLWFTIFVDADAPGLCGRPCRPVRDNHFQSKLPPPGATHHATDRPVLTHVDHPLQPSGAGAAPFRCRRDACLGGHVRGGAVGRRQGLAAAPCRQGAGGKAVGYFSTAGASFGLQAGAQTFGYAMFFMNDNALAQLRKNEGMGKSVTTKTMKDDIYAFIYGQSGLMAGLGVQGNKITQIHPK